MAKVERLNVLNKANPQVHFAADVFPMMDDEALQELAADIKANGLLVPIVVDNDGTLIDGRNRLKACQIAGVDPTFQTFEGDDPIAYIVGINISRRHLSSGQKTMAVAKLYPDPEKGGRGRKVSATEGFSSGRLSMARHILKWAPELADLVLAGTTSLDAAHSEAKRREQMANSAEAKMERLKQGAADLAALVTEERMTLDEATAAWERRSQEQAQKLRAGKQAVESLSSFASHVATIVTAVQLGATDLLDDEAQFSMLQDAWDLLVETRRGLKGGAA
jgi:hypothetical protein